MVPVIVDIWRVTFNKEYHTVNVNLINLHIIQSYKVQEQLNIFILVYKIDLIHTNYFNVVQYTLQQFHN